MKYLLNQPKKAYETVICFIESMLTLIIMTLFTAVVSFLDLLLIGMSVVEIDSQSLVFQMYELLARSMNPKFES